MSVANGSVKIGNIVTPVTKPVDVQFATITLPNSSPGGDNSGAEGALASGTLPPPEGANTIILTQPDRIPGSLFKELGCPSSDPTVESLCKQTQSTPGGNVQNNLYLTATNRTTRGLEVYVDYFGANNIANLRVYDW